jgi:hypothetical protein
MSQISSDTGSQIVFTFMLQPGQAIVPGTWPRRNSPAMAHRMPLRATPNRVSGTSGGVTATSTGHF